MSINILGFPEWQHMPLALRYTLISSLKKIYMKK